MSSVSAVICFLFHKVGTSYKKRTSRVEKGSFATKSLAQISRKTRIFHRQILDAIHFIHRI